MERNLASSLLLHVLATMTASQEGSPDCLLGNDVPVCDYMKFLIRKPLAPGSTSCLFKLLLGHRYFLSSPSSLPANWALATTGLTASRGPALVTLLQGPRMMCHQQLQKSSPSGAIQRKEWSAYCCVEEALPRTQPSGPGLLRWQKQSVGNGRQKTCYH